MTETDINIGLSLSRLLDTHGVGPLHLKLTALDLEQWQAAWPKVKEVRSCARCCSIVVTNTTLFVSLHFTVCMGMT